MSDFSRYNCPVCGDKAHINCRFPEQGQTYAGSDKLVMFRIYQVQCFTGCRTRGPQHTWMISHNGEVCKNVPLIGINYHPTPEAARKAAMRDWNKMCKALAGVFYGK